MTPGIETSFLSRPEIAEWNTPPILEKVWRNILPTMRLGKTSHSILEAFSNIDITAERLAEIISGNPRIEGLFEKHVLAQAKKDSLESIESGIVLLGMQRSRNFVVALEVSQSTTEINPKEVLSFALQVETALENQRNLYPDTAFAAGVFFDALTVAAKNTVGKNEKVTQRIQSIFRQGMKCANAALEISKGVQKFNYQKFVFATALIHEIGKAAMLVAEPEYLKFLDVLEKKPLPKPLQFHTERLRFGVSHATLGYLCWKCSPLFAPLAKAALFFPEPHLLEARDKNTGSLARVIHDASLK